MTKVYYTVIPHRNVSKNDIPKLENAGLKIDFDDIVLILKSNPFLRVRNMELLKPKNKRMYSMRINEKHRVVYTVDKVAKVVKIWSAWSHYDRKLPK
jgi:Txe/YoeB family toxin of toxin-antitoxin system